MYIPEGVDGGDTRIIARAGDAEFQDHVILDLQLLQKVQTADVVRPEQSDVLEPGKPTQHAHVRQVLQGTVSGETELAEAAAALQWGDVPEQKGVVDVDDLQVSVILQSLQGP